MKQRILSILLVCTLLASLSLTGCGGGNGGGGSGSNGGGGSDATFVGAWKLVDWQNEKHQPGQAKERIKELEGSGQIGKLFLREDGTATLDVYGLIVNGTWKASSSDPTAGHLSFSDALIPLSLQNGVLSVSMMFESMLFERSAALAASDDGGASGNTTWGQGPRLALNVIFDDEICTIELVEAGVDSYGAAGFILRFTNNSAVRIWFSCAEIPWTIDGKPATAALSESVQPGSTREDWLVPLIDEAPISIDALKNVRGQIKALNQDTNEVIRVYDFSY